jgi:hypothetical protein
LGAALIAAVLIPSLRPAGFHLIRQWNWCLPGEIPAALIPWLLLALEFGPWSIREGRDEWLIHLPLILPCGLMLSWVVTRFQHFLIRLARHRFGRWLLPLPLVVFTGLWQWDAPQAKLAPLPLDLAADPAWEESVKQSEFLLSELRYGNPYFNRELDWAKAYFVDLEHLANSWEKQPLFLRLTDRTDIICDGELHTLIEPDIAGINGVLHSLQQAFTGAPLSEAWPILQLTWRLAGSLERIKPVCNKTLQIYAGHRRRLCDSSALLIPQMEAKQCQEILQCLRALEPFGELFAQSRPLALSTGAWQLDQIMIHRILSDVTKPCMCGNNEVNKAIAKLSSCRYWYKPGQCLALLENAEERLAVLPPLGVDSALMSRELCSISYYNSFIPYDHHRSDLPWYFGCLAPNSLGRHATRLQIDERVWTLRHLQLAGEMQLALQLLLEARLFELEKGHAPEKMVEFHARSVISPLTGKEILWTPKGVELTRPGSAQIPGSSDRIELWPAKPKE